MPDDQVTFLGDVVLPYPVDVQPELPPNIVLNIEGPITASLAHTPQKISLKSDPNAFDKTFPRKLAAVNLANNHTFDYGAVGFESTIDHLRNRSIPFFGAGSPRENSNNPVLLSLGGQRLALLGYVSPITEPITGVGSYGCALLQKSTVLRDIDLSRGAGADFIVVSVHWGLEQVYLPRPEDVSLAREILAAGADLIVGHHAHRIQPWEQIGSKAAFFGLGNAIFPQFDVPPLEASGAHRPVVLAQRPWNRRSIAVTCDLTTGALTTSETHFNGHLLTVTGRPVRRTGHLGGPGYALRHRLSQFTGRFAYASQPYLADHRMPRTVHVRLLYRMLVSSLFEDSQGQKEAR